MANVNHSEITDHITGGGNTAFPLQSFYAFSYSPVKPILLFFQGVQFPTVIPWHQNAGESAGLCGSQQVDADLRPTGILSPSSLSCVQDLGEQMGFLGSF